MPARDTGSELFHLADKLLIKGEVPSLERLQQLDTQLPEDAQAQLQLWWQSLAGRLAAVSAADSTAMPDFLCVSLSQMWNQAVAEARSQLAQERLHERAEQEQAGAAAALKALQADKDALESEVRQVRQQLQDSQQLLADKETESIELSRELASEVEQRKELAHQLAKFEQTLETERKAQSYAQSSFDQRIKDQQRAYLEAQAKAETEVRHFRSQLEKARDEAGRSESDLSRQVNTLSANLTQREMQAESLKGQLRTLSEEVRELKKLSHSQQQEIVRLNNQLLAEVNKNKRLSDKMSALEEQRVRAENRVQAQLSESTRRENEVRQQLQARELELQQSISHKQSLERRLIALEDEAKRLHARS